MSYYIVTYDVSEERVNKVRKVLKKYFMWVQNSVFEGELSDGRMEKCRRELFEIIKDKEDSIYFYSIENKLNYKKIILGMEKDITGNFL